MKETIEHNNRFYGEDLKTESEQYKEWLVIANKEIERLNNKVEELMTLYTTERNVKEDYKAIIKEAREYIQDRYDGEALIHTFDKCNVKELLDILQGSDKE